MNSATTFLKMKTPADMLAVHFIASNGLLDGKFVQEVDPPWTIWWLKGEEQGFMNRIGRMLKTQIEPPEKVWETGVPASEVKDVGWLELFKRSVIRPKATIKPGEESILLTTDRDTFFRVIKEHFMLQQGKIEYAVLDARSDHYIVQIQNPSVWVFNNLGNKGKFAWFNKLEGHSGIFLEAGYKITGISGTRAFNQFQLADNGLVLIQKSGKLLALKPEWKKGEKLIKIEFDAPNIPQKDVTDAIKIVPRLRATDHSCRAIFWKISDRNRFKAILMNESLSRFRGFEAWFCKGGEIFIRASARTHDRGLASILTDAFPAFYEAEPHLMLPLGQVLAPALSAQRLQELFETRSRDFICIEDSGTSLQATILANADLCKIEDFIVLETESALNRAQTIKPLCELNFSELKKKKIVIEIEVVAPKKLEAKSDDGQVGVFKSLKKKKERSKFFDLTALPNISESQTSSYRTMIQDIDRKLCANPADAALWHARADLCTKIRTRVSALVSLMNAAIIENNGALLAECIIEYCEKTPEFKELLSDNISETQKGALLSRIRNKDINSELHYLLTMLYAARFDDPDIYQQAVAGMKSGFAKDNRQFFNFNEVRIAAGGSSMNVENRVELLTAKDMPRISMNLKKFLLQIGCCSQAACIRVIKLLLHRMFSVHLNVRYANELIPNMSTDPEEFYRYKISYSPFYPRSEDSPTHHNYDYTPIIKYFCDLMLIQDKNMIPEVDDKAISRWLKLLSMEKIRETPLRDFFTGDLYKPPFNFDMHEEAKLRYGIARISWIDELINVDIPAVSDGKPIARAIYERFSDGVSDWADFFKMALKSKDSQAQAKSQRLLLLMVSEFGPNPEFQQFIIPAIISNKFDGQWDIFRLTMYCDMYRLCLAYRKPVDEQRLFNMLVSRTPQPPGRYAVGPDTDINTSEGPAGWKDFKGSAEWIILCLLLSSSPVRRFQLDNLAGRAAKWLEKAYETNDYQIFAETLTILGFLAIGILADLVPEKLELHQLLEKRKVLWIQHAFAQHNKLNQSFKSWQSHCGL